MDFLQYGIPNPVPLATAVPSTNWVFEPTLNIKGSPSLKLNPECVISTASIIPVPIDTFESIWVFIPVYIALIPRFLSPILLKPWCVT